MPRRIRFRRRVRSVVTLIVVAGIAFVLGRTAGRPTSSRGPDDDPSNIPALSGRVRELDAKNDTLENVLNEIAQQSGASIVVDWKALEASAIERNAPVAISLHDVPIATALDAVAGQQTNVRIGWRVEGNTVCVSTLETVNRSTVIRLYDVRPFLDIDPATFADEQYVYGFSGRRMVDARERLMTLISNLIEPDSWHSNGGYVGSINSFGNNFIVRHTPKVQEKVAQFLADMRSAATRPLPPTRSAGDAKP